MPSNLVKTPGQEALWEAARNLAGKKKSPPRNKYAYTNAIYQNMKRGHNPHSKERKG